MHRLLRAIIVASFLPAIPSTAREPLAQRIGRTDPAKYKHSKSVHGGPGENWCMTLMGPGVFVSNLRFMHRCELQPKSGIGHHFHNTSDEMFVIFDGEAQFTIDGRTALVAAPAGVPLRATHAHAILNPSDKPLQFMNINVMVGKPAPEKLNPPRGTVSSDPTATFDLGDDRTGALLDRVPAFMTMRLNRELLRPVEAMNGGKGKAMYRRAVGSSAFNSNWSYVDHLVLPPGVSLGKHKHAGVEEIYYLVNGEGTARINEETAAVTKGDAVPVLTNETHSFENTGAADLEFMIIGMALEKGALDSADVK